MVILSYKIKNIQRKRAHERAKQYSKHAKFIGICEEQGR